MNEHRENEVVAGSMQFYAPAGKSKISTEARIYSECTQEPSTDE